MSEFDKDLNSASDDLTMNGDIDWDDENAIVCIYPKKPGFDDKNGKYRVLGTLTHSSIFRRKGSGTNIAPSIGYKVEEIETGKVMLVTKEQGVWLCARFGMRNAYITQRTKERKGTNGEVLQESKTTYLNPYPTKQEAFTQDARVVTAFKLNADCKPIKPLQLAVKEEECTPELWRILLQEQKKGNKTQKRARRNVKEVQQKALNEVISALKSQGNMKNPFRA